MQTRSVDSFRSVLTPPESKTISGLTTPAKIQAYLDRVPYSEEEAYRCPLAVLRDQKAHCFDGALFGAAMLRRIGHPPVIVDMLPNDRDDDHVLAIFKVDGHLGAVAKSNFSGLRYREPIFRTLRELILSYFENFFNSLGEKTLRAYTVPLNLKSFDDRNWMTSNEHLDDIADRLDGLRQVRIVTRKMVKNLAPVDERSLEAGLLGSNEAGLFKPKG